MIVIGVVLVLMQWAIGIKPSGTLIGEVLFLYGYGWVESRIRFVMKIYIKVDHE